MAQWLRKADALLGDTDLVPNYQHLVAQISCNSNSSSSNPCGLEKLLNAFAM